MLQYVNGFACSINETKENVVIHFLQKEPAVPDSEGEEEVKLITNKIASIVMDSDCAKGLISSIAQLYEDDLCEEEE